MQPLSNVASWLSQPSNSIVWLGSAEAQLRQLAEDYRRIAMQRGISTKAFYETQPVAKLKIVVDASNADPGVVHCRALPAPGCDHMAICKVDVDSPVHSGIVQWLRELGVAAESGRSLPCLGSDIEHVLTEIAEENPSLRSKILPVPRRWNDIPVDVRAQVSHAFRDKVEVLLTSGLARRLENDRALTEKLVQSRWELDQMIYTLWIAQRLRDNLASFAAQLRAQAHAFESHVGEGPRSLIPIFRLVDSLREALCAGSTELVPLLRELEDAIARSHKAQPDLVDQDGRTRQILADGGRTLAATQLWRKPSKQKAS